MAEERHGARSDRHRIQARRDHLRGIALEGDTGGAHQVVVDA